MEQYKLSTIIFGVASLQGLLLMINVYFLKNANRRANLFLLLLITSVTLLVFQNFIILADFHYDLPHLIFLFYPFNALIGPFFFLYVAFLIDPERKYRWYDLLHLLLFLYVWTFHWPYIFEDASVKVNYANHVYQGENYIDTPGLIMIMIGKLHIIGYAGYAIYMVNRKYSELRQTSSNNNINYISRFRWIAITFCVFMVLFSMGTWVFYQYHIEVGHFEIYAHITNSIILLALSIIAMQQPDRLFFVLKESPTPKKNSKTSSIETIKHLMEESKPYLNPELKLQDLSTTLEIPSHTLSEQINNQLDMNFYELVNGYRVEEFKRRIQSNEYNHLTLLAIAFDVGFNSKSSFNRIFKKKEGMTPREFMVSQKVSTSKVEA